jgi:hypothetical protein
MRTLQFAPVATFDQLSDEQRAIVELVLQQGKSYDQLSDLLGMPERRVRELARDALVELAPLSARSVEEDWRGQLADYVLGQQAGPEATATRGHLRRSEAARSWTRSLLDSLEQLYPDGDLPVIPEGERSRERGARRAPDAPAAERGAAPAGVGAAALLRRRILAAAGALALLLFVLLVWPVGLLTGDGDEDTQASSSGDAQGASGDGSIPTGTRGSAIIAKQQGRTQIVVTATGLEPSTQSTAYQVWLYNSEEDRRSLGAAVTDARGNLQSLGRLPANYADYEFIDVTSVSVVGRGQSRRFEQGPSVLRGLLELREKPVTRGQGSQRTTLLASIPLRPLPSG